jgi:hypothetical protein
MVRRARTIAIGSALAIFLWQGPSGLEAWGLGSLAEDVREQAAAAAPLSTSAPATLVCSRAWVGHEDEAETFLETAGIAKIDDVPIGVTRPKRAFFTPGGMVRSAAWKPLAPGMRHGYYESYKSEIAAYELDKLLEMHMVPPVVERKHQGEMGAAIWWIEPVKGWKADSPVQGPEPDWSKQVSRMKLFDQLIANIDRNQGNLLYDSDWHLMLIDHSRAFTSRRSLDGIAAPTRIDRDLWRRIDALTAADLQRALGSWIGSSELQAILARRDKMRSDIARMVRSKGETGVFFD